MKSSKLGSKMWLGRWCKQMLHLLSSFFVVLLLLVSNAYAEQIAQMSARCPSEKFQDFFYVFSEKKELQNEFTQVPLSKLTVIDAIPEPRPIINDLQKKQIVFPLIPNQLERKNQELSVRLSLLSEGQAKAVLAKKDTDYLVIYFFKWIKGCWVLTRIENWSL